MQLVPTFATFPAVQLVPAVTSRLHSPEPIASVPVASSIPTRLAQPHPGTNASAAVAPELTSETAIVHWDPEIQDLGAQSEVQLVDQSEVVFDHKTHWPTSLESELLELQAMLLEPTVKALLLKITTLKLL